MLRRRLAQGIEMPRTETRATLDLIYEAALEPERWPEALTSAADNLGAIGGMLTGISLTKPDRGWFVNARLDPDLARIFLERHQDNPWSRAMIGRPWGQPVCLASTNATAAVRGSLFEAEVLTPQGITSVMSAQLRLNPDIDVGGVGFPLKAPAERDVIEHAARLTPHLQRAVTTSFRLAGLGALNASLGEALARLEQSVLLVDGEGRVVFASASAETLLRSSGALRTERGRLSASRAVETRALQRLIAEASCTSLGGGVSPGGTLALPQPSDDTPLAVVVAPLRDLRPLLGAARPTAIVLAGAPSAAPTASAPTLRALYGLTPAEAAVAAAIGGGRPLAAAAADLGISPLTARTHLKRVFDKTGVHRQVELVRLIARLPGGCNQ